MLSDPSTYIGFATSAATTRGGGPTRANTGGAEPIAPRANIAEPTTGPRVNVETNAPRVNPEVNAPRPNVEPTAPRANAPEVTAPRTNVETPAPRATAEPTAPRGNVETPTAPRADVDAPKTNTTETVKASRLERFQNTVENIQGRFTRAGERVGQTAGVRTADVVGVKAQIPTVENPTLKPGEQKIVTNDGQTRIEVAPGTKDIAGGKADIEAHRKAAVDDIRGGRQNTRESELALEVQKHREMGDWRMQEAAKLPDGHPDKLRLMTEAADMYARANDYNNKLQDASTQKGSGTGEINAKNAENNNKFKTDAGGNLRKIEETVQQLEMPNGRKYKTLDGDDAPLLADYDLFTAPDGKLQLRQRSRTDTDDNALQIKYDSSGKPIGIELSSQKPVAKGSYKTDSDFNTTVDTTQNPYRSQPSGERDNVSSGKQNEDYNKGRSRREIEKATVKKTGGEDYTDTPEWKAAHHGMNEQSRLIGEEAAHAFIKGTFGDNAELVYGGPGKGSASGDFDQVWKVTNPDGTVEYVVVEAKGGSAQLGSREVGDADYRYQQGTKEYFESVQQNMSTKAGNTDAHKNMRNTGDELQAALLDGQVRYIHVETPIVTDPITGKAYIGNTRIREFDLNAPAQKPALKPAVDPSTTPTTVNPAGVKPDDLISGTTTPKPAPITDATPNLKNLSDINKRGTSHTSTKTHQRFR
jgi:hypothetical protein